MKLRINPLVVSDLKAIRDYIAEDNAEAARNTVDKIYKSFENIQQFPTMGADLSKRVSFKTDYKYLVHGNYRYYSFRSNRVAGWLAFHHIWMRGGAREYI